MNVLSSISNCRDASRMQGVVLIEKTC